MKGIAHPGVPQSVGGQADVVLAPDLFILEGVDLSQSAGKIPGQGVDPAALLDVLDDDREVGAGAQDGLEAGVDINQPIEEYIVVTNVSEVGWIFGVGHIEVAIGAPP